jgi:hypothetical protein
MNKPNWMYPKDVVTLKYWLHIFLDGYLFTLLWLIAGQIIPQVFGFVMPQLSLGLLQQVFMGWIPVVVSVILALADITVHSILKLN